MADHGSHARIDCTPLPTPPPTEFASERNDDGVPVTSSIDWGRVVHQESRHVASWILYLHRRQDEQIIPLLETAASGLAIGPGVLPSKWPAFRETGVMRVCVDLMMEPGMLAPPTDLETFGPNQYVHKIIVLLSYCIRLLMDSKNNPQDAYYSRELYERRDEFFKFLWDIRLLISSANAAGTSISTLLPMFVQTSITWLVRIFDRYFDYVPTLSTYAAHSLLYHWSTCKPDSFTIDSISILRSLMAHDKDNIQEFVNDYISHSNNSHLRRLFFKFCQHLSGAFNPAPDEDAFSVFWVSCKFFTYRMDAFVPFDVMDVDGPLPSLTMSFHRQRCSGANVRTVSAPDLVKVLLPAFKAMSEAAPDLFDRKLSQYGGTLDVVSMIGQSIITVIEEKLQDDLDIPLDVLKRIQVSTAMQRLRDSNHSQSGSYVYLLRSTTRIWHDTLLAIDKIRAKGAGQRRLKDASLVAWRDYGSVFNLKESIRNHSAKTPSKLSDKSPYWKIKKRCFSNECACSVAYPTLHKFRVCKGCYRALYCSAKCQAADWEVGHRATRARVHDGLGEFVPGVDQTVARSVDGGLTVLAATMPAGVTGIERAGLNAVANTGGADNEFRELYADRLAAVD
ncbi:hypothetical protein EIP91_004949 [Steccherinum ochraceum]|uniref:MYND-type domain-containing protein n=1 Tax=Steccherinum ochraceum TaxID=92696 RepID=A0A4R0RJ33_9APHY|nr:hypothetical protein EIP91_004949 [Steccherinum ochraceum]